LITRQSDVTTAIEEKPNEKDIKASKPRSNLLLLLPEVFVELP
jgi:hypothetical protein